MKFKEICFVCSNKINLSTFSDRDQRDYQEFTGFVISLAEKVQICIKCKRNLEKSLKFLHFCKESYVNFQNSYGKTHDTELTINDESSQDNLLSNEDVTQNIVIKSQEDFEDSVEEAETIKSETLTNRRSCKYEGCDKSFSSDFRLKVHLRIHTREKPYICEWENCNMKFAQSNALVCHKRIHLNEKPYVCKICGRKFTQNTTLKTHVAAKHVGNSVECDIPGCDKKFPRNSFLMLHKKRDHQNVRNYKCNVCDNQYKQKSHLDRHIQAAHQKIRHQCLYCEKSFSKNWSLKLHQFKHSEASNFPYKCSECDNSFQRRDMWIKHVKKIHPGVDVKKNAIEIHIPIDIMNKAKLS